MWKLLAGVGFSLLPRYWRKKAPGAEEIPWEAATSLSGIIEFFVSIGALVVWYSVSVTNWAGQAIESVLRGGPPIDVGETIGFAALVLWVIHPLTWLIGYFVCEGVVRTLGAGLTGHIMGTLPLFLADRVYGKLTQRAPEGDAIHSPGRRAYLHSFLGAIRDLWEIRRLPQLPDEMVTICEDGDEYREIRACRPKPEWVPPRVVRVAEFYYRLEAAKRSGGPRPFIYKLRRLPAGVPGRTVIVYNGTSGTSDA